MRIVLVLDWFLYYATELANALAERHDVLLVTRDHAFEVSSPDTPMTLDEYLSRTLSPRVQTERLRYRRGDPRNAREVLRVQRAIRRWRPDVVHFQDSADWRLALLAWLNRDRTTVLTIHDVVSHPGEERGLRMVMHRTLARAARKIIVHGDALREQLRRVAPKVVAHTPVAAIPHGVLGMYKAWDAPDVPLEPRTVLFFGRMTRYKGLDVLVRAQALVSERVPGARFVIAGRGEALAMYATQLRAPGFEVHDRFIANAEVAALFRRAAVVVLPYTEASQSGVIPVAYAFGTPVIVTRIGSLPEVVDDGGSGLIVAPGNAEELAAAIVAVLTDSGLRARLAVGACRMRDTRLSWRTVAEQTERFYRGDGA